MRDDEAVSCHYADSFRFKSQISVSFQNYQKISLEFIF